MKVRNMESNAGNTVANQFIIEGATITFNIGTEESPEWITATGTVFQSYNSVIAVYDYTAEDADHRVYLDRNTWDYSVTTGKYRNQFLGETKKETQAKIDSGEYTLADLN